jgi:hypothetical protein
MAGSKEEEFLNEPGVIATPQLAYVVVVVLPVAPEANCHIRKFRLSVLTAHGGMVIRSSLLCVKALTAAQCQVTSPIQMCRPFPAIGKAGATYLVLVERVQDGLKIGLSGILILQHVSCYTFRSRRGRKTPCSDRRGKR